MKGLIASEARKLLGAKATWGIALAMVVIVVFGVLQTGGAADEVGLALHERQFFFLATINAAVMLVVLGAKFATDEFRFGTVVPTLLASPRRHRVVVAKLAVVGAAGMVAAAGTAAAMLLAGLRFLDSVGAADLRTLGGFVLAGGLLTTLGAGVGLVVRHQVAAIVGAIVWLMVVEQMLRARLQEQAVLLPGAAAGALSVAQTVSSMLTGGLILAVYAAVAAVAATVVMRRRDVV